MTSNQRLTKHAATAALGALLLSVGTLACGDTSAELDDAAVRMQYAFYTGDSREIDSVLKQVEESEVERTLGASKSYQLAYGNWKLAQLHRQSMSEERPRPNARSLAMKAAQNCSQHARNAAGKDPAMAEAYALQAICDGFTPKVHHGSGECANSKPLRTAVSLAPSNPRIRFVQALCASGVAPDPAAADRWRAVVQSFDAAPASQPGKPDWGHVEALTILGETYLQRGDPVAARDVLERALVLAPDYRQAQQLLQSAAARPH